MTNNENLQTRAMGFVKGYNIRQIAQQKAETIAYWRSEAARTDDPKAVEFAQMILRRKGE